MFWSTNFNPTTDLPELTGKVIIVTGANTGLGYHTVKNLARKGAKVYLGARSEEKGRAAVAKLQEEGIGSGEVIWLSCDLSSPALAKKSAEGFLQLETRLDVLVNNAGCTYDKTDETAQDGITVVSMVNHFGTFQFTMPLVPLLIKTSEYPNSDVRIVILTSDAHRRGCAGKPNIDFSTLDEFRNNYANEFIPFFSRYFISKLGNVLFCNALQRKLSSSSIICTSIHPGVVNTNLDSLTPFPRIASFLMWLFLPSADAGSYSACFAAASLKVREEAENYKGAYLVPVGKIGLASEHARNVELQDQMWKTTEKYLAGLSL